MCVQPSWERIGRDLCGQELSIRNPVYCSFAEMKMEIIRALMEEQAIGLAGWRYCKAIRFSSVEGN